MHLHEVSSHKNQNLLHHTFYYADCSRFHALISCNSFFKSLIFVKVCSIFQKSKSLNSSEESVTIHRPLIPHIIQKARKWRSHARRIILKLHKIKLGLDGPEAARWANAPLISQSCSLVEVLCIVLLFEVNVKYSCQYHHELQHFLEGQMSSIISPL